MRMFWRGITAGILSLPMPFVYFPRLRRILFAPSSHNIPNHMIWSIRLHCTRVFVICTDTISSVYKSCIERFPWYRRTVDSRTNSRERMIQRHIRELLTNRHQQPMQRFCHFKRVHRCSTGGIDTVILFGLFQSSDCIIHNIKIMQWSSPNRATEFVRSTCFTANCLTQVARSTTIAIYIRKFFVWILVGGAILFGSYRFICRHRSHVER
mmetsp:Transcript_16041/g.23815  ORF Transcript_16041/g.23815 Transcript_16041/m.23815 type:complete len:210 (+) Transcript_16041:265-894(+)